MQANASKDRIDSHLSSITMRRRICADIPVAQNSPFVSAPNTLLIPYRRIGEPTSFGWSSVGRSHHSAVVVGLSAMREFRRALRRMPCPRLVLTPWTSPYLGCWGHSRNQQLPCFPFARNSCPFKTARVSLCVGVFQQAGKPGRLQAASLPSAAWLNATFPASRSARDPFAGESPGTFPPRPSAMRRGPGSRRRSGQMSAPDRRADSC